MGCTLTRRRFEPHALGTEAATLDWLYAQIPRFDCIPGCTDCCGPISVTEAELARLPEHGAALVQHLDTLMQKGKRGESLSDGCVTCPYAKLGRCAVYENRPYACRLFGTVPRLKCPHGKGPETMIDPILEDTMRRAYERLLADGGGIGFWMEIDA